jgi:hypothetical protein
MVTAQDGKMVGLRVGGWLVMFGAKGVVEGAVTYPSPAGTTEHLVVDLKRGTTYAVSGAAGGDRRRTASGEGTLRFTTRARGAVTLTPTE